MNTPKISQGCMDNFFASVEIEDVVSIYDTILCKTCRHYWVNESVITTCNDCSNRRISIDTWRVKRLTSYQLKLDPLSNQFHLELSNGTFKPGRYIIFTICKPPAQYQLFHNWFENACVLISGRFFSEKRFIGKNTRSPEAGEFNQDKDILGANIYAISR